MFQKILIANRGEIACRVIRTARRLGIATVAVYSDADADAWHAALADEALGIGPAPAADSYLRIDRIVAAAKAAGAEAVHPGYGFLAENPAFVEAVEAAGLVFIGPSAEAMRAMGLKDAAKALMQKAGVPIVPGYHGERQEPEHLAEQAAALGYPVLIKARAGGGGKGMRRVAAAEDFAAALDSAKREAAAAFGDDAVLIETYVSQPRHIEIQVFGDRQGQVVHLFERDCSLQRRHQKVLEEAPAAGMPAAMRAAMGTAAVRAAEAIGYVGAGTVEFITDASAGLRPDRFYFMEMNTRLQVEHPVTEAITGVDLVEWQLRVAAGEPLPLRQDQLAITGWAFEARLYAEDPATGFLPAIGRLERLDLPADRVRIDSGVRPGDRIAPYYDPMIAKIVSHGPTRATALNQLAAALGQARIAGTVTNLEFLGALCRHPGVAAGAVDTGLIERDLGQLVRSDPPPAEAVALAGLAALGLLAPAQGDDPWDRLVGWRAWQPAEHHLTLLWQDETYALAVLLDGRGRFRVSLAERTLEIDVLGSAEGGCRVALDGRRQDVGSHLHGDQVSLFLAGRHYAFQRPDLLAAPAMAAAAAGDRLLAPMPGLVRVIFAAPGQVVRQGEPLVVLEAMKMEHSLAAPADGVVAELAVRAGDQVQAGALLLTLTLAEA